MRIARFRELNSTFDNLEQKIKDFKILIANFTIYDLKIAFQLIKEIYAERENIILGKQKNDTWNGL